MTGLAERLIEDWLIKADERSYQLSLASCLSRDGHVIEYLSPHSTLEHGKDVVTRRGSELYAYQLKAGGIDARKWRDIEGEVREASRLPFRYPDNNTRRVDRAYLVLSGYLTDAVRDKVALMNADLKLSGHATVDVVELPGLVAMFRSAFETLFPNAVLALRDFLALYISDGRGWQSGLEFSKVIGSVIVDSPKKAVNLRSFANAVIASEFLATPYRQCQNHIGVIQTWVFTAVTILRCARRNGLPRTHYQEAMGLCHEAIVSASNKLLEETFSRDDFLEGDPPLDAPFLPYRRLVVLGYVGAVFNSRAITGQDVLDSSNLLLELTEREQPLTPWGEGAWNFVLQIAVALSRSPTGQIMGQAIASQWLTYACPAKGPWPKDPYWSVLDQVSVARRRSTVIDDTHERMKLTYSVDSALGYLVRRLWRQPVRLSWPSISRFSTAELVCDDPTEYLQWRTKTGSLLVNL